MRGLMLLRDSETSLLTQPSLVLALYAIARHRRPGLGHVPLTSCQRAWDVVTKMQPTLLVSWSARWIICEDGGEPTICQLLWGGGQCVTQLYLGHFLPRQWDKPYHYYCTNIQTQVLNILSRKSISTQLRSVTIQVQVLQFVKIHTESFKLMYMYIN